MSPHVATVPHSTSACSSTVSVAFSCLSGGYLLSYARDFTIAAVEAKPSYKAAGDGLQQAKDYAEILNLRFCYATNGKTIIEFDFTTGTEREIDAFPSPDDLWGRYRAAEGLADDHCANRVLPGRVPFPSPPPIAAQPDRITGGHRRSEDRSKDEEEWQSNDQVDQKRNKFKNTLYEHHCLQSRLGVSHPPVHKNTLHFAEKPDVIWCRSVLIAAPIHNPRGLRDDPIRPVHRAGNDGVVDQLDHRPHRRLVHILEGSLPPPDE